MKKSSFFNIIKSFLVLGMLFSSITPAFANEANTNSPGVTVEFVSDIPCVGLSEPFVVPYESADTAKILLPDAPTAKGHIFQGYRRIYYKDTGIVEGEDLWQDGDYLRVWAIEDSKVYFRAEWIPVYDHADIPSINYDKSNPVEKWTNLQFVESAELSHILINGEVMPESGYSIIPSFTIDDYKSVFLLTFNNDYLDTLEVGDYEVVAVTSDNRTNKLSLSIYDTDRITFKFNYRGGTGHFEYRESIDPPTGHDEYKIVTDYLEVRRGTPITLCGVADEGYDGYQLDRNGHALHGTCDKFIAGDTGDHVDYLYYMVVDNQELTVTPGGYDFGIAQVGYDPIQGYRIRIKNTGHRNIDLKNFRRDRGFESDKFVFSKFTCRNISDYDGIFLSNESTCEFTVKPKDGLPVGKHNEVIEFIHLERDPNNVGGYPDNVLEEVHVAQLNLSFEVLEEVKPEPEITTLTTGSLDFGGEFPEYEINETKQIEFENTGNVGLNLEPITAKHFDISPIECREGVIDENYTIPVGEKCRFDVKPKTGLPIGIYEDTINIYNAKKAVTFGVNDSDIIAPVGSFKAKFIVKDPTPPKVQIDFNYNIADSAYVEISNRTIGEKVKVTDKYVATKDDAVIICAYPKEGYKLDQVVRDDGYVLGGNCNFVSADDMSYDITTSKAVAPELKTELRLDQINLDFAQVTAGYEPIAVKQMSMVNTGETEITINPLTSQNFVIGGLDCGNGVDANNFTIPAGSTCKFDVKPKDGLAAGNYAEKIIVKQGKSELANFDLNFVVNEAVEGKVNLYFTYNNPNSAYVYYENLTTNEKDTTYDRLVVNKGDEVEVCPMPEEGYVINAVTRDGTDLQSECDKFIAESDVNYNISTEAVNAEVVFSPAIVDFGEVKVGYTPIEAWDVELDNSGNVPVNITKLHSQNFILTDLECENSEKYDDLYFIPNGSKCRFTAKPKDGLAAGVYNETINIYDHEVQPLSLEANNQADPIGNLKLRFMVKGEATETVDINFVYNIQDAAYIYYENETTNATGTVKDKLVVNKGDKVSIEPVGNANYVITGIKRNDVVVDDITDVLVAEADTTYYITVEAKRTEVKLNPTSLDFGKANVAYKPIAVKQIEMENTGNTEVVVGPITANNFEISNFNCTSYQKYGDNYLVQAGSKCKFDVKPKDGLSIGEYVETVNIYNQTISSLALTNANNEVLTSFELKFVVEETTPEPIPEEVKINFVYNIQDAAYIDYMNKTVGKGGWVVDELIVNKGDTVNVCAREKEGYNITSVKRNDVALEGKCDTIVAEADTTYYITVKENKPELTLNPKSLDFGQTNLAYQPVATKQISMKNTGETEITIDPLTAKNFIIGALDCGNGIDANNYTIPVGSTCKFDVKPKDDLKVGEYAETIKVIEDKAELVSFNLKFVVNETTPEPTPEKVKISFEYNIKDAAYIDFFNETIGEGGWITDELIVNKGDKVNVCAYENTGYIVTGMKRDGTELAGTCDNIVAQADTTYYISAREMVSELKLNPSNIDFGKKQLAYSPIKAVEVEMINSGDTAFMINELTAKNYIISDFACDEAEKMDDAYFIYPGTKCKFNVKPKDGLAVGEYAETVDIYDLYVGPLDNTKAETGKLIASLNLNFVVDKEKDDIPQTNDDNHIMVYGTISLVALGVAAYLNKKRKTTK